MIPQSIRSAEWSAFLADLHPGRQGGVPISTGDRVFERDLKEALEASERFVMKRPDAHAHIYGLLEEIGLEMPLDVAVQYAAQRVAVSGDLPQGDMVKLHEFYEFVVWPVIRAQDTMMLGLVDRSQGLSMSEAVLLRGMLPLAAAFDRLFFAWRAKVVVPYQLGLRDDPGLKESVSTACPNHYSVLVDANGQFVEGALSSDVLSQLHEVPFVVAFPVEVGEIDRIIGTLDQSLGNLIKQGHPVSADAVPGVGAYLGYFRYLRAAITSTDLSTTEKLWARVDRAWLRIDSTQRVMPVHMMEDGYHHPTTVTPEFRVLWRSAELAEHITLLREAITPFGSEAGDDEFAKKLAGIDADAFILMAGGLVDFRLAGQSVPNRSEVQEVGMRVILDPVSMRVRQSRFEFLLRACLGQETLEWLERHFNLVAHFLAVIGHELGHPWLINAKIKLAFGTHKPSFEETKATLLGLKAMKSLRETFGKDLGLVLVAYLVGEILRRFEKNAAVNQTFRPYYNEAKTIATCLLRGGVLFLRNGKIEINWGACNDVDRLLALLEDPFDRLMKAYQAAFQGQGEEGLAQALAVVEEYAPDPLSPDLEGFFQVVNANLERPTG